MMNKQKDFILRISVFSFLFLVCTCICYGQNPVTLERVKKVTATTMDSKHNNTSIRSVYNHNNQKNENNSYKYKKTNFPVYESVIEGVLENGANQNIYFEEVTPDSRIILDSVRLDSKGHFKYRYAMPYKTFINVKVSDSDYIVLLPELGEKIEVRGNYKDFSTNYEINAGIESQLLWQLQDYSNHGTEVLKDIVATDSKNRQLLSNGYMSPEEYDRQHYVTDSIYLATYAELQQYVVHFIEDNLGSLTTLIALYKPFNNHPLIDPSNSFEFYEAVLEGLQETLPDNPHTLYFKNVIERTRYQNGQ